MTCNSPALQQNINPTSFPSRSLGVYQNFKEIHNFLLTVDFKIIARNAECFVSRGICIIQPEDKSACAQRRSLREKQTNEFLACPPLHIKQLLFVK